MKRLIVDVDETISYSIGGDYKKAKPNTELIEKLRLYQEEGFEIVLNTSRNVRTFEGNVGKINVHTLPLLIEWLNNYKVPYDEIYVGKPWCGNEGFYIDDKAVRPKEFLRFTYEELKKIMENDK